MGLHLNIFSVNSDVTHWPGKKMKQCTCILKNGLKFDKELSLGEVEIVMFLKDLEKQNILDDSQIEKLSDLIYNFGDEKYEEGSTDSDDWITEEENYNL